MRHAIRLLAGACAALGLAAGACRGASSDEAPRPDHLLLISVDTLRADHLESYGYARSTSPFVSKLAQQGVRFEDCVTHSPQTLPSHGSLFSGIPALQNLPDGADAPLPESRTTLAEVLGAHGFRTVGITGGAFLDPAFGLAQGFDTWTHAKPSDRADDALAFAHSDIAANTERALRWLAAEHEARFFLFFHTYEVHSPYEGREVGALGAPAERVVVRGNKWERPLAGPGYEGWRRFVRFSAAPPADADAVRRRLIAAYDSEIRATDAHLGRLLEALERHGLAHRTLVVFTSDHGEAFLEHGRTEHGHLYGHNLRVPLILRAPGRLPARTVVRERVQQIDVAPTVLDLLGVETPPEMAGISLVPRILTGQPLPRRAAVAYDEASGISYIAADGTKVIANLLASHPLAGRVEIYDLGRDPVEARDLSGTLDPARRAELFAEVGKSLNDLPGAAVWIETDRPARFEGTLELFGPKADPARLRSFPLEAGWFSFAKAESAVQVRTGVFQRWWLHSGSPAQRLSIRGELVSEDGLRLVVDESFAFDRLASDGSEELRRPGAGGAAFAASLRARQVGVRAGASPALRISDETRAQLEVLGYAE